MAKKALARIAQARLPKTAPFQCGGICKFGKLPVTDQFAGGVPKHFVEPTVVDPAGNFELDLGPIMRIEAG
jgi:hypothetical protein